MRPILVNIPSKLLFLLLLVGAAVSFGRDLVRRRRDRSLGLTSTPLYLLVFALVLDRIKSGSLIPSAFTYGANSSRRRTR